MRTFNELSVAVPDEIRVTGMLPVPLTTLHQPCAEIGATAVAHMIQRLEDPSLPARDTLLDFHIVVRQSCGSKEVH
jgi:DNA-binding LacI/PurR family transcriptional regulator